MPRRARFTSLPPAGIYHATNRGVARLSIAADDHDRRSFVALLNGARRQNDWQLLAYCLMPNHFHLVAISALERLSRGMHFLSFRYAQRFNERHDRVGHLFQGRFRARSVDAGDDVSALCAYVFENPVRAALCASAAEWPWTGGELLSDYAVAWTGERAGAHEQSGDTSPLRPFRRR